MTRRYQYKRVLLTEAVQSHLDWTAQVRGYDGILSLAGAAQAAVWVKPYAG